MGTEATGVVPIFATPFGSYDLAPPAALNDELQRVLRARATDEYRHPGVPVDSRSFVSREGVLDWPEEPLPWLRASLLDAVARTAAAVNSFPPGQMEALRLEAHSWFALIRPLGRIPASSHPMFAWCAVYGVAAPDRADQRYDSGALRLYELRLQTAYLDATNWGMRAPYGPGHHIWHPRAGHAAVFPATHPYELAINRSNSDLLLVLLRARFVNARVAAAQ